MAKRGGFSGFPGGGMNMQNMMQQAQRMQQNMAKKQEELNAMEFTASAGGGVVSAVVYGNKSLKEIRLAPEVVDPEDVEMLEDLITAAVNEAMEQADKTVSEEMGKLTGGMNLGGLF